MFFWPFFQTRFALKRNLVVEQIYTEVTFPEKMKMKMAELLPLKKYPFEFYQFCKGLTSSVKGLPVFEAGPHSGVGSSSDSRARGPGFDTQSAHILLFLLPLIQEGQL